jgi:hypothetical protein
MGEMRSVYNDLTGNYTMLSQNNGAINGLQQLLCNMTAASNTSVFQYSAPNFERGRNV